MNKTLKLLSASVLMAALNSVSATENVSTEELLHDTEIKPILSIPIDQTKSMNDDQPVFTIDIKARIVNGVTDPYNAYRHGLADPENRSWVGQTTDENARTFSLAWDATGTTLYSITRDEVKKLVRIDPETLDVTAIGTMTGLLPNQVIQGMTIDQNNTCYVITTDDANHDTVSSLYRCNLGTGALTLVGTQSDAPDLHDIVATCDDTIYGVDSYAQSLYKVSKQDGSVDLVGVYGINEDYLLFNMAYDRINGDIYQYVIADSGIHSVFASINKFDGSLTYLADEFRFGVDVGAIQSSCADRADSFQLNPGFNGAWFNPETVGQGFLFDVFPTTDLFFAAWFTYDDGAVVNKAGGVGSAEQRWVTASGAVGDSNVVELTIYNSTGGVFDDPAAVDSVPVGTMTVEFEDCSSGFVSYVFDDSSLSGSFPIQRVAGDNIEMCENLTNTAVK